MLDRYDILLFSLLLSVLALHGCGEDFEPYNTLSSFRVMAIGAEPPWAGSGEAMDLRALVHTPEENAPVDYRWSWCPLPVAGEQEIVCSINPQDFQDLVAEIDGTFTTPSYDLGTSPEATLPYPVPVGAVTEVCEALQQRAAPTLLERPDCAVGMTIGVILTARHGAESINTFRRVFLTASDEAPLNQNPSLATLVASAPNGESITLDPNAVTPLDANTDYTLFTAIPDAAAEQYAEDDATQREDLSVTWFIQTGTTEVNRTGYIDAETTLDEAGTNVWSSAGDPGAESAIHVVVRDNRYGLAWLSRRVLLK